MGTLIGYARTASRLQDSTQEDANLAKQRAALLAAGCDSVFPVCHNDLRHFPFPPYLPRAKRKEPE